MVTEKAKKRIIYYQNELVDEFSEAQITPKKIDGAYDYLGGVRRKIGRFFLYHIVAKIAAFIYLKNIFGRIIQRYGILKTALSGILPDVGFRYIVLPTLIKRGKEEGHRRLLPM